MPRFDSEEERDQADAVLIQQYETALAMSKDRLVAKIQEILDSDVEVEVEDEDEDEDERPFRYLTFNRAVYETRDDHLRVWWKVEAGRGEGSWFQIEDGDDAEAIAEQVMDTWEDWDDEDGLAIDGGGVHRNDDGYGHILTIEQLRRQTDYY